MELAIRLKLLLARTTDVSFAVRPHCVVNGKVHLRPRFRDSISKIASSVYHKFVLYCLAPKVRQNVPLKIIIILSVC